MNFLATGIDFGTTNSVISVLDTSGKPQVLEIDPSNSNPKILKSLIYLNPDGSWEIGQRAVERYLWDVKNIPAKPPRLEYTGKMIKTFGPSSASGAGKVVMVPEVIEIDDSGRGRLLQSLKSVLTSASFRGTNIFGKFWTIEKLLAMFLGQMKTRAEEITGRKLEAVTLGRPVKYVGQDVERIALERMEAAAREVGFKEIRFEFEPVGAALSFGVNLASPARVLVFDFGGGTLDICVMKFPEKKVEAVVGRAIGGDLLNSILVNEKLLKYFGAKVVISGKLEMPRHYFLAFRNWFHLTLLKNVAELGSLDYLKINADDPKPVENLKNLVMKDYGYDLFARVDEAKVRLSEETESEIGFRCPDFGFKEKIKREEFEAMIETEVEETKKCLEECLEKAGVTAEEIDKVLITGGSSKIPIFANILKNQWGEEKLYWGDRFTSVGAGLSLVG